MKEELVALTAVVEDPQGPTEVLVVKEPAKEVTVVEDSSTGDVVVVEKTEELIAVKESDKPAVLLEEPVEKITVVVNEPSGETAVLEETVQPAIAVEADESTNNVKEAEPIVETIVD